VHCYYGRYGDSWCVFRSVVYLRYVKSLGLLSSNGLTVVLLCLLIKEKFYSNLKTSHIFIFYPFAILYISSHAVIFHLFLIETYNIQNL